MEQNSSPYKDNLKTLIEATETGKVYWQQQNPSTYFYNSELGNGMLFTTSIQRLALGGGYVFRIINKKTEEIVLDMSAGKTIKTPADYASPKTYDYSLEMHALFSKVEAAVTSRSAKIFKDIIDNIGK